MREFDPRNIQVSITQLPNKLGYSYWDLQILNKTDYGIDNIAVDVAYKTQAFIRDSIICCQFRYLAPGQKQSQKVQLDEIARFAFPLSIRGTLIDGTAFTYDLGSASPCFVTTAAFNDPQHPTVQSFRSLRDDVLVRYPAGRAFIGWYNQNGPGLAAQLRHRPIVRAATRAILNPLAGAINAVRRTAGQNSKHTRRDKRTGPR